MGESVSDIVFLILFFLLAACTDPPQQAVTHIRTPDPIQAYVDANSSQGTAVAAIATADYFSNQLTATVEARNQTATQQVLGLQSTQQAIQNQSTERAWNATSTADSIHSTTVAASTASDAAQQAIWPWSMLVIFFKRWTRVRIIQCDPRGDAPLLLDVVDGAAYDANRHPTSTAGLLRKDIKRLPQFSASDHTQTTAHDQMVDTATRGLPSRTT